MCHTFLNIPENKPLPDNPNISSLSNQYFTMPTHTPDSTPFNADALLSQMPGGILRWGNTMFLIVISVLLLIAWTVRYPQFIRAPFVLETDAFSTSVYAPADGQIGQLAVPDSVEVKAGALLLTLQSRDAAGKDIIDSIKSPQNGLLQQQRAFQSGMNISKGTPLFMLKKACQQPLTARMLVPHATIGKIRIGQPVLLHFEAYPTEEFGVVRAVVQDIGQLPVEQGYIVYLSLPSPLKTSQNMLIQANLGVRGAAEIMLDNPRLLERLIQPLKMFRDQQRIRQAAQSKHSNTTQYSQKGD